MTPTSLKEISARVVKTWSLPFTQEDLPRSVIDYLSSANCCVNPECKGEKEVSRLKFTSELSRKTFSLSIKLSLVSKRLKAFHTSKR